MLKLEKDKAVRFGWEGLFRVR